MAFNLASSVADYLPASFEPIFIAYAALIAMAVVPIYFGSKFSIEEAKVFTLSKSILAMSFIKWLSPL